MIINPEELRPGSILFVKNNSLLSRIFRKFGVDGTYTCVHLICGGILEAGYSGIHITPISKYLNDSKYQVEIINVVDPSDTTKFVDCVSKFVDDNYHYMLTSHNCGRRVLGRVFKALGLLNDSDSWICGELIARSLRSVGVILEMPSNLLTPAKLYILLKGAQYDRHRPQKPNTSA